MSDIVERLDELAKATDLGFYELWDLIQEVVPPSAAEIRRLREENAALRAPAPFSTYPSDHMRLKAIASRIKNEHMCEADRAAMAVDLADLVYAIIDDEANDDTASPEDLRLLRQAYTTLAFAFTRLHGSARSRDGELCLDFQKVRSQIEARFKQQGVKL